MCLRSGFRWYFHCTVRHDEDGFRMAGRVCEKAPPRSPMSHPGVEGCMPAGRAFFSWGKLRPVQDETREQRSSAILH